MDGAELDEMLGDIMHRESKLSDWEKTFIQSITEQYQRKGELSEKQLAIVEKIWNKVT